MNGKLWLKLVNLSSQLSSKYLLLSPALRQEAVQVLLKQSVQDRGSQSWPGRLGLPNGGDLVLVAASDHRGTDKGLCTGKRRAKSAEEKKE